MVTVYFENTLSAEIVAVFASEKLYDLCTQTLEREALKKNCILTESVTDEVLTHVKNFSEKVDTVAKKILHAHQAGAEIPKEIVREASTLISKK